MGDLALRFGVLLNVVIPLLCFMACVYLALHIAAARLTRPDSSLLWFFGVVTGPLTRPIRSVLPAGASESRVRLVSLGVYLLLWIVARVAFLQLAPGRAG